MYVYIASRGEMSACACSGDALVKTQQKEGECGKKMMDKPCFVGGERVDVVGGQSKKTKKYNGASWELNPGPLACFAFLLLSR